MTFHVFNYSKISCFWTFVFVLSVCCKLHAVTVCFLLFTPCSAYERKTSIGFKPLTPPSTPVSPCSSTNTHAMHEQTPPLVHNSTLGQHSLHGQPTVTNSTLSQRALPLHSQTPPFAVPCPPQNHNAPFNNEHRWELVWFTAVPWINYIINKILSTREKTSKEENIYIYIISVQLLGEYFKKYI